MIFWPHSYQEQAISFLAKHRCAALFADPGLGKTGIILTLLNRFYFSTEPLQPALIIAPKRVAQLVWPTEIQKFSESFGHISYAILHGSKRAERLNQSVDLYLLNVENIFWALGQRCFRTLVIDESTKFKSFSSKRFKALRPYLKDFKRRYILTGTPTPKSIMDLFTQQYIVDRGQALGERITHYRTRYFTPLFQKTYTEWIPKRGAWEAVHQRIAPTTMRLDQHDHLELPELIHNEIRIKLPPKAQSFYHEIEQKLFAEIEDAKILVSSASQLYGLCCQVANGRAYEPKNISGARSGKILKFHSEKLKAITDLVDELQGKPVLIAYHYRHDLAQLLEAFGSDTPYIGSDSPHDIAEVVPAWNDGRIPVLLGQPMSMAHGLNLQGGGHDIIWIAPPDNLEDYLQFNQRIWRQGVVGHVRIHHIIAMHTVDELKLRRLRTKTKNQTRLLEALKGYRDAILEMAKW